MNLKSRANVRKLTFARDQIIDLYKHLHQKIVEKHIRLYELPKCIVDGCLRYKKEIELLEWSMKL